MFPSRYLRTLEKQSDIDEHELSCMLEDRQLFLLKATRNYIQCLRSGDAHNLRVFRLTSLWFNNTGIEEINNMMEVRFKVILFYMVLCVQIL